MALGPYITYSKLNGLVFLLLLFLGKEEMHYNIVLLKVDWERPKCEVVMIMLLCINVCNFKDKDNLFKKDRTITFRYVIKCCKTLRHFNIEYETKPMSALCFRE